MIMIINSDLYNIVRVWKNNKNRQSILHTCTNLILIFSIAWSLLKKSLKCTFSFKNSSQYHHFPFRLPLNIQICFLINITLDENCLVNCAFRSSKSTFRYQHYHFRQLCIKCKNTNDRQRNLWWSLIIIPYIYCHPNT